MDFAPHGSARMPRTTTPGITINGAGHCIIDKEHRGVRIYVRLGPVSEEQRRLTAELQRIELELQQKANALHCAPH